MVEFQNQTVDAVIEMIGDLYSSIVGASVANRRQRNAPRIPGKQISDYRINHAAVAGELVDPRLRRNAGSAGQAAVLAPAFIGSKPEGAVFYQRATQRAAELVVMECILRERIAVLIKFAVKGVARIQRVIAEILKN